MTIAQQLNIKSFPFIIKDDKGNCIYYELREGYWEKREYDAQGNHVYFENSSGYWHKKEYDTEGKVIYFEDSNGKIVNNRPKTELTMDEIAKKFNIPVTQLKIKK